MGLRVGEICECVSFEGEGIGWWVFVCLALFGV